MSEDNVVLIIFGKTYLLSKIILLGLNNIVNSMTPLMANKLLVDKFEPLIDRGSFLENTTTTTSNQERRGRRIRDAFKDPSWN